MKKGFAAVAGMGIISFLLFTSAGESRGSSRGAAEFNEHCAACHPNGGNIITPGKTLHKKDMEKNNIKNADDIVRFMRNPGPLMTPFNKETIPDEEAKDIAEYILSTFK